MGVKVTGGLPTAVNLKNTARRSSAGAREALKRGADKIQKRAVKYAPRLHTNETDGELGVLEEAIEVQVVKDDLAHGRHTFDVIVNEDKPAPGNKTVGDYATIMHETDYDLGPESEAKGGRSAGVGNKYLERAYLELEDEIRADI